MLVDKFLAAFASDITLELYIQNDLVELSDLLVISDFESILDNKDKIYTLIAQNQIRIRKLNLEENNIRFIFFLLEISQRLRHRSNFIYLYKYITDKGFSSGSRLKAAALYYNYAQDYFSLIGQFDTIHNLLQKAIDDDNDEQILVYSCFVDYYAFIVVYFSRFNVCAIQEFNKQIDRNRITAPESFLNHTIIDEITSVPLGDINYAILQFNRILKDYSRFGGKKIIADKSINIQIEFNSDYCNKLQNIEVNFNSFLTVSKKLFAPHSSDAIWQTLKRGVSVIENPIQLLGYMHSFGEMHGEKIKSALKFIKNINDWGSVDIIDWGCGQAIGSICLLDELKAKDKLNIVNKIYLIEPSLLSIQRAGFNLSNYLRTNRLKLLNKGIDYVYENDFQIIDNTKIHLLSNILDVEEFSLNKFLLFLNLNFKGVNYFICTSPKLPHPKDYRFYMFIEKFRKKSSFLELGYVSEGRYEWKPEKKWTRVISVFKVTI